MFMALSTSNEFTALTQAQQAQIWGSFFDALDAGDAGLHPLYSILAPLYAAGEYTIEPGLEADMAADAIEASFELDTMHFDFDPAF